MNDAVARRRPARGRRRPRHRRVSRPVRHRAGRREEDRRGRRLRALQEDRVGRARAHGRGQEQHPARRPLGNGQDAAVRDASRAASRSRSSPPRRRRWRRRASSTTRSRRSSSGSSTRPTATSRGPSAASSSSTRSTSSRPPRRARRAPAPAKASSTRCSRSWRVRRSGWPTAVRRHRERAVHLRRRVRRHLRDHLANAHLRLHLDHRGIPTVNKERILERLNTRIKPTDLFTYGSSRNSPGDCRSSHATSSATSTRHKLVRIMTEPRDSIYRQFREIFGDDRRRPW